MQTVRLWEVDQFGFGKYDFLYMTKQPKDWKKTLRRIER